MSKKFLFLCLIIVLQCQVSYEASAVSPDKDDCSLSDAIKSIRRSFRKVVPKYYANSLSVTVPTDGLASTISYNPTNPRLVQVLQDYISIGKSLIDGRERDKPLLRSAMYSILSYEYSKFLWRYGQSLVCVSYLLGVVNDYGVVSSIQDYASRLKDRFQNTIVEPYDSTAFKPVKGREILKKLGIEKPSSKIRSQRSPSEPSKCHELIVPATDTGNIFIEFPLLNESPTSIDIPGSDDQLHQKNANLTRNLEEYYNKAITCLTTEDLRAGFAQVFGQWLSSKLVPSILKSSTCSPGFHSLLILLADVDEYINVITKSNPNGWKKGLHLSKSRNKLVDYDIAPYIKIENVEHTTSAEHAVASTTPIVLLIFLLLLIMGLVFLYFMYFKKSGHNLRDCIEQYRSKLRLFIHKVRPVAAASSSKRRQAQRKQQRRAAHFTKDFKRFKRAANPSDDANVDNFRDTSRDIYIKLREYPLEISTEETDFVQNCHYSDHKHSVNEFTVVDHRPTETSRKLLNFRSTLRKQKRYVDNDIALRSATDDDNSSGGTDET